MFVSNYLEKPDEADMFLEVCGLTESVSAGFTNKVSWAAQQRGFLCSPCHRGLQRERRAGKSILRLVYAKLLPPPGLEELQRQSSWQCKSQVYGRMKESWGIAMLVCRG